MPNGVSYYVRKLADAKAENLRLCTEHRSAFVAGWLAMCEAIERGSDGKTKFNGADEMILAESLFEEWKSPVSDKRVSTENGRAEKVDSPVIADDRQEILRVYGRCLSCGYEGYGPCACSANPGRSDEG